MNILTLIPHKMKRVASTRGGEYHGPCPFCGGTDRFRAHPDRDRARCRKCQWSGDSVELLRTLYGLSFQEACARVPWAVVSAGAVALARSGGPVDPLDVQPCSAPPAKWQARARKHAETGVDVLWGEYGGKALDYLRGRGFTDRTIEYAGFGYYPRDTFDAPEAWGLTGKKIWIPAGIRIPWVLDNAAVWNLRVRRLDVPDGESKYMSPRGCSNGLLHADFIRPGVPVVLVEGEFDAWTIGQEADGLILPVATGSTTGSRRLRWVTRLALASVVLVAYDTDEAGETAAEHWLATLPNARRWRPYWGDASQMHQDGADIRTWLTAGLFEAGIQNPKPAIA